MRAPMLLTAWLLGLSAGRAPAPEGSAVVAVRARYLMGTTCRVTAWHEEADRAGRAAAAALDEVAAVEALLSTWRDDSELSRLNRRAGEGPVEVSADLAAFLDVALRVAAATGGAFDPTVGPLVDAWDLRGEGRVPDADELAAARAAVGFDAVRLHDGPSALDLTAPGARLDAGAVGKGWALDRAAEVLRDHGVSAALLDFGGQLLAVGAPPGADGFRVAIADPLARERPAVLLVLRDASIATSAQSERGRRVGEDLVGHVIDPRTGRPVPVLGSATAWAPTAAEADALSTAFLVLGPAASAAWVAGHPDDRGVAWLEPTDGGLTLHARGAIVPGLLRLRDDVTTDAALAAARRSR